MDEFILMCELIRRKDGKDIDKIKFGNGLCTDDFSDKFSIAGTLLENSEPQLIDSIEKLTKRMEDE